MKISSIGILSTLLTLSALQYSPAIVNILLTSLTELSIIQGGPEGA
jgi:hypothetical protein